MHLVSHLLGLMTPVGSPVSLSPLWTPAISVAVGLELAWLGSSLAVLLWLSRPLRLQTPPREPPRKSAAVTGAPNESWELAA